MPATAARAEYVKTGYRTVKNGPVSTVVTKYADAARKTLEPVPTFFEAEADAQAMCAERGTLLSADRRAFNQAVSGEATGIALAYTTTAPQLTVKDTFRQAGHAAIISEFSIDFGKQQTIIQSWG
jgi:hypothetical protein